MPSDRPSTKNFLLAAGVVAHTLWTSVAPTIVYPLYARQWDLTPTVTAGVFAVYPLVVVATLILFGGLSDTLGSRRMMLYGVAASAMGVLVFGLASDVAMLFLGRVLMGIGVGLSAGPSAAALVEAAGPGGVRKASAATLIAQAFGFAAALLIGGALAQYAPYPTRLSFLVLFLLLVALLLGTWSLPRQNTGRPVAWRPRLPKIPRELRRPFWLAAFTVMTAYGNGALIGSLGAQIAHELVQSDNLLVNGTTLALFPVALGMAGLGARGLCAPAVILWGAGASVAGMGCMAAAVSRHELGFLAVATMGSGVGYALMVYGGLALLGAAVPEAVRGATTSAAFLLSYLFTGVLTFGLGRLATVLGTGTAVITGVLILAALCALVVLFTARPGGGVRRAAAAVTPTGTAAGQRTRAF
ncbi:MFS transporter [Roseomonas elaeocarpi]|uniref:MFS transporter n=1 Tax=Roseomonas elaeocarpi TaxID=907779 RepID=A0ABV6JN15_9PROT